MGKEFNCLGGRGQSPEIGKTIFKVLKWLWKWEFFLKKLRESRALRVLDARELSEVFKGRL